MSSHERMHIAIDLDDVILDFVGGLRKWISTEYDVEIPEDTITDFNLAPFLNPIIGKNWWTAFRERDWLWPNFGAVPGAIGAIERLSDEGYELEIVTSKPKWARYATWQWIGKWRPAVTRVTIVGPDDVKADHSNADMLIDDKLENVKEWVESDPDREAVLFTRPHNRNYVNLPPRVYRADNWGQVLGLIERLGLDE